MKKKTHIKFKPFDSLEWNEVTDDRAKEVLTEADFKKLKKNKVHNINTGTFKIEQ
jgi:hypothetical protein